MHDFFYLRSLSVLAAIIPFLLSACAPQQVTYSEPFAGQVTNRATHRPIAGATVSVVAGKDSVQTHTDQAGNFRLPALRGWVLAALFSDGSDYFGTLHAEAVGFRPITVIRGQELRTVTLEGE